MTELYRVAAKLLGLKFYDDYSSSVEVQKGYSRLVLDNPVLPVYLAHLICEKEGWWWGLCGLAWRLSSGHGEVATILAVCGHRDPDAVIRAFVEKYKKTPAQGFIKQSLKQQGKYGQVHYRSSDTDTIRENFPADAVMKSLNEADQPRRRKKMTPEEWNEQEAKAAFHNLVIYKSTDPVESSLITVVKHLSERVGKLEKERSESK